MISHMITSMGREPYLLVWFDESLTRCSEWKEDSIFPELLLRDAMRWRVKQKMPVAIVLSRLCQRCCAANLVRFLDIQARRQVDVRRKTAPHGLGQDESEGKLGEFPRLAEERVRRLRLRLVDDLLEQRLHMLLQNLQMSLADRCRVPDMQDAVDGLLRVLYNKSNKQQDCVASRNVRVAVIQGDVDGLIVALRDLSDCFHQVSDVTRCCINISTISVRIQQPQAYQQTEASWESLYRHLRCC